MTTSPGRRLAYVSHWISHPRDEHGNATDRNPGHGCWTDQLCVAGACDPARLSAADDRLVVDEQYMEQARHTSMASLPVAS